MRAGMATSEQLYLRLPWLIQSISLNTQGWLVRRRRFNSEFVSLYNCYLERVRWPATQIREYRDKRLLDFLCWAETQIPFYAERFKKAGFSPIRQGSLQGFDQVDLLDKATVQENAARIAAETDEPTLLVHTSGSTGGGLRFPTTLSAHREQWACWQRFRRWHGIGLNDQCAYFGGRSIISPNRRKPPYWRWNFPGKQLMFSAYHLGPATADSYINALKRSELKWIHGYPSLVALLASLIVERSERIDLRWVSLGSENVTPAQRSIIEAAFQVAPIQHYGMAEGVANISQWPDGVLRVDEDFAHVEFIPRTDGLHEIIGTNFTNRAFPLIRYRVGDLVELPKDSFLDQEPGRPVLQIDGRLEDYLVMTDGTRLGRLDHVFKDCVNVREAQFVQSQHGSAIVNVVPNARYSADDDRLLKKELRLRFGDRLNFQIRHVNSIERTSRGKLRLVISECGQP